MRNPTPRKIKKIEFGKKFSASDEEKKINKKSSVLKKEEYGKFKDIIGRLDIKSGKKEKNKSGGISSDEKISSLKNLSF